MQEYNTYIEMKNTKLNYHHDSGNLMSNATLNALKSNV